MLPLHWKSCFDRNTPHITEFATVAKSLPHSLRKAHKSLISNIFLFQYRFFRQNPSGNPMDLAYTPDLLQPFLL